MRFVVVAAALVAGFLGLASCQMDCAFPDNSNITDVLVGLLRSGDSSSDPVINVIDFTPRCLAVSAQRDRFRFFSVLVEYTCTGHSLCPTGTAREQIESEYNNRAWNNVVLGTTINTRDTNVTDPPISVPTRRDCAVCASPTISASTFPIGRQSDDIYHCVACATNRSANPGQNNPGQNACTDLDPEDCCNVYVYDSATGLYKCATDCPEGGFVIDSETFMCLITCDDLGNNVVNGTVRYSTPIEQAEGRFRQGTTATVTCDTGFTGGDVITCERSGEWSAPLPTCEPAVDCGDPPTLDNGRLTVSPPASTILGSIVTYECNDGFVFAEGSAMTRECLNTGDWSNEDIRCVPVVDCGDPPALDNGRLTETPPTSTTAGSTVTYECNDGYGFEEGSGAMSRTCLNTGEWSNEDMECSSELPVVDCGDPPTLDNGRLTVSPPASIILGSVVTYECNDGFVFAEDSAMTRECLNTGDWSNEDIRCVPVVDCGDPPALDNGRLTETPPTSTTAGSTVTYECNDGYVFEEGSGAMSRTCLETGEWSSEDIKCDLQLIDSNGDNNSGGSKTYQSLTVLVGSLLCGLLALK